jgi:hypothetical protein
MDRIDILHADEALTVVEEARLLRDEAFATRLAYRTVRNDLRRTIEALRATLAAVAAPRR